MNFKMFYKLFLIMIIMISLVAGAVSGGIALSHRITGHMLKNNPIKLGAGENINENQAKKLPKNQKVNVVLLGVDADGYRTDTIIFAQYNTETKKVNMIQIPRDLKIQTTRYDKKINSAYAFGGEKEIFKCVKDILDIEVDKYVLLNIKGFKALIDEIGGITMDVPINMNYRDPVQDLTINLKKGEQVLDGKKAEMFVRFRKNSDGTGYPDGDIGRVKAQQIFINATVDKLLSFKNVLKIPNLISIVAKNIKTNFKPTEIAGYIDEAFKIDKGSINIMILPGKDEYINKVSYFICDKEQTKQLINEHFIK